MLKKIIIIALLTTALAHAPLSMGGYKAQQCEINLTNKGKVAEITCINSDDWFVLKNIKKGQYSERKNYLVISKGKKVLSLIQI